MYPKYNLAIKSERNQMIHDLALFCIENKTEPVVIPAMQRRYVLAVSKPGNPSGLSSSAEFSLETAHYYLNLTIDKIKELSS